MQCKACEAFTCLRHGIPWHNGMSCAEYDERLRLDKQHDEDNAATAAFFAAKRKICPGPDCQVSIIKDEGCDHFTCELLLPALLFK
jgi:hypothetical protein